MEPVTRIALERFLQRLGERYPGPGDLYLLGGCALCLLGNPRTTVDVDYTLELESESFVQFQEALSEVAAEMRLDVDEVPLAESSLCHHRPAKGVGSLGAMDNSMFTSSICTASP